MEKRKEGGKEKERNQKRKSGPRKEKGQRRKGDLRKQGGQGGIESSQKKQTKSKVHKYHTHTIAVDLYKCLIQMKYPISMQTRAPWVINDFTWCDMTF